MNAREGKCQEEKRMTNRGEKAIYIYIYIYIERERERERRERNILTSPPSFSPLHEVLDCDVNRPHDNPNDNN